ncbi:MAG: hypothetical protein OEY55_06090 [Acidimicrobiia bacterium]|nr:hypothetical protein [Acidimicrobiia bacterium]MDH5505154.1 hypothetical protein [Acidimicrobiia bacterium]
MKPLEESLLSLAGIEQAHVRLSDDGPAGVRVVLSADADRAMVAKAIRELFTTRGLTVAVDEGRADPEPGENDLPELPRMAERAKSVEDEPATARLDPGPPASSNQPPVVAGTMFGPVQLAVAVSEGPTYCDVAVRVGPDRRSVRRSASDPTSIREAILDALNEASGRAGLRPNIVSVDQREVAHKTMVTVVLESSGQVGVGSALLRGTEFHAFGIACLSALQHLPTL